MNARRLLLFAALALLVPPAAAHTFGQSYTLPVPIWMYLYGAAAALAVSFLLVGYFIHADAIALNRRERELPTPPRWRLAGLRALSLAALALTVIAGFAGTDNAYQNLNMTLFWVIFYLGFTYFTALAGNWFAIINPLRVLADLIERVLPQAFAGRYRYPAALSYWPALLLYAAFIWIELFGRTTPFSLALATSAYIFLNLLGCWLIGKKDWFERCEFFGVFLGLVARLAPLRVEAEQGRVTRLSLRRPFIGLLQDGPMPLSLLLFILFMLSSTAFDGLKETALWVGLFWKNLYQWVLIPLYGDPSQVGYATIKKIFLGWQTAVLLLSPCLYFAVYALFLFLSKRVSSYRAPLSSLLLSFGYCLVPIAFVYHAAHYYTLLPVQGAQMLRLVSDPLGLGWNLFGTANVPVNVLPNLPVVWHVQVFLIIAGHIVSVYLAHLQALRIFPDRRSAILSQLPALLLMVAFTAMGLWLLSLPLAASVPVRMD